MAYQAEAHLLTNAAGQTIIKVSKSKPKGIPNTITQMTNAKGGIDRNYYGKDGKQIKQVSNNGHGHKSAEAMGVHGEHGHDYLWDGEDFTRPMRELTQQERKENEDII